MSKTLLELGKAGNNIFQPAAEIGVHRLPFKETRWRSASL